MALLVLLPLAAAVGILTGGRRAPVRWLALAAPAVLALVVVGLLARAGPARDGAGVAEATTWVPSLDLSLSFRLDGFALLMGLVVAGVGTLVLAYSVAYFAHDEDPERVRRFTAWFLAFAGSMLGLVLADDGWTLFLFWEATSITSFVLIGLDDRSPAARASAQRALLVTAAGGLCLLGGLVLVTQAAGASTFAALAADPPTGAAVSAGLVLVLVGAATKSAQVPFHFWLPGAMAAPTPVSAFLHSATMVKAGVILVARLAPVFAEVTWWRPAVVVVGTATMLVGGVGALRQHDAKLLLAHGTVSQLGLLVVLFGLGHPGVTAAAVAVLVAHALFKATLFLVVGAVDHAAGTRDIRRLTGGARSLPVVAAIGAVAAASMAGLPPLLGFVAKEAAVDALLAVDDRWATAALVGVATGSVLTVAYTARLWLGVFTDVGLDPDAGPPAPADHRPAAMLAGPPGLLAGLTVAGGLAAAPLAALLDPATVALDARAHAHLTLWAGVHAPLVSSAAIVLAGAGLHVALGRRARALPAPRVSGEVLFQRGFDGLLTGARRLTGVVQSGSLPAYLSVIVGVVAAALVAGLAGGIVVGPVGTIAAASRAEAAVALTVAAMAIAVLTARRRFVSVLLLGTVGYGLAVLFLLWGAPDLALTQLLIETVMLVVFLLVLRRLPEGYVPSPEWAPRALRVALAVAVGVSMAAFALMAGTARTERPVADEHLARAYPEAGGHNVVNVILVDFRGIDTLGEITVLAVAAVGVANLVRAARRGRAGTGAWRAATARSSSSVVFAQTSRLLFPLVLAVSLYVAFKGHNAPGGGFAGGLIAGAAFLMRSLAGDQPPLARTRAVRPTTIVGAGLALAVLTGIAPLVAGRSFLESSIHRLDLPLVGPVKLVTSAAFDVGVYLVVLGVVLSVLENLGPGADLIAPDVESPGGSRRTGRHRPDPGAVGPR